MLHRVGLQDATRYQFSVSAFNSSGNGNANIIQATTLLKIVEASSITITDISENEANIAWGAVSGAATYCVLVDGKTYDVSGTSIHVYGLTGGTYNTAQVHGVNESGMTDGSQATFLTLPRSPEIQVTSHNESTIELTWNTVQSATSYVEMKDGQDAGQTSATTMQLLDLSPGETYSLHVYAINETGKGQAGRGVCVLR